MGKRGSGNDKSAKKAAKSRAVRAFALGDPGAFIRIAYPLATPNEQRSSLLTGGGLLLFGGIGLFAMHGGIVLLFVAIALLGGWTLHGAIRPGTGFVFLDDALLRIGPMGRIKDVALDRVAGISRGAQLGMLGTPSGPEENMAVSFARTDGKPGVDLAVAVLPRATIDELERRIAIRARALRSGDPRASEAAEARWLAGDEAIGVMQTEEGWRPVGDTDELAATTAHPFRETRRKIVVCVTPAVWEAIVSIPDLADRLEPIVVEER